MPTPDIDNAPEEIDVPDQLPSADVVPTPSPDQAAEVITSGTGNPQPQIEAKATNLIEVLNRLQNLTVETFFAANPTDDAAIAEQRIYFKDGLTIDTEADNLITAHTKLYAMNTFLAIDPDALEAVYTLPLSTAANMGMRGKPQLHLYFVEVNYSLDSGRDIADADIKGNRLMEYTTATLQESDLIAIGERTRDLFRDFLWEKGKSLLSYSDPERGYNLQILCRTKDGGMEMLTKVLAIREDEVVSRRINFKENNNPEETYPDTQQEIQLLGKTYKTGVRRPECTVKLKAAFLHIEGLIKPKVIYDNSGKYKTALVKNE